MPWDFTIIDGPYGNVTEGPAWDGSGLLFTYIEGSQILRFDPETGGSAVVWSDTNNANGLMLDASGTLFACEGGARRVVRYESDGSTTVLADGFDGQKLNIPNDLAIDPEGRVWFTDPFYEGAAGPWSLDRSNKELDHDSVYRLDPGADGTFPEGTIHYMVEERLADMAKKARAANKDPDDWDDDGDSDAENDNSEDSPAETRHTYY